MDDRRKTQNVFRSFDSKEHVFTNTEKHRSSRSQQFYGECFLGARLLSVCITWIRSSNQEILRPLLSFSTFQKWNRAENRSKLLRII